MPRGRVFTPAEDSMLMFAFNNFHSEISRMNRIRERISNPASVRPYASYLNRWRFIRRRDRNLQSTSTSYDSDSSDSDDENLFSPTFTVQRRTLPPPPAPTPAPASLKRTIEQMSEDELTKYEVEINEKIKRRKEEIEKEKKSNPECPLCLEDIKTNCVVASCGHVFCTECYCKNLSRPLQRYTDVCHKCPTCRASWDKPDKVNFINSDNITVSECKEKGAKISV